MSETMDHLVRMYFRKLLNKVSLIHVALIKCIALYLLHNQNTLKMESRKYKYHLILIHACT